MPVRKPYRSPQLLIYGNLAELTRNKGNVGLMDGGPVIGQMMTS